MHIPDGFITGSTTAGFSLISAAGIFTSLRYAGRALAERTVPLAGLIAAFIFAVQMFNFPVMPGMSGHLLGGVLAAVLVGPSTAIVIMTIVLGTQAIFFADGGLTALGLNIFNLGLVGAGGGYLTFKVILRLLRKRTSSVAVAAGIAAGLSVPLSAAAFAIEFSLGGAAEVSIGAVSVALIGTHSLIGIVEGILTTLVVAAMMATRPDLVNGAPQSTAATGGRRVSRRKVLVVGLAITAVFAIFVSQFASNNPDGLEFVAEQKGFSETAEDSRTSGSPLSEYGAGLTGKDTVDTAIAGMVGILIVLTIGWILFYLLRRGEQGTPHAAAGGHVHALYQHKDTVVHQMPAHVKLLGGVGFILGIVATPREAFWAFALFIATLSILSWTAKLRPGFLASRMLIEIPFAAVALLLPFFSGGEQVTILNLALSKSGLWTMWNILIKATLGLWMAVIIGSTMTVTGMLTGLERLRVPRTVIGITGFMMRYLEIILGQFGRMRRAMESRAHRSTSLRSSQPFASAIAMTFIRSYERGERIYLAMASRGFTGKMPSGNTPPKSHERWLFVTALLVFAWTIAALGWILR